MKNFDPFPWIILAVCVLLGLVAIGEVAIAMKADLEAAQEARP